MTFNALSMMVMIVPAEIEEIAERLKEESEEVCAHVVKCTRELEDLKKQHEEVLEDERRKSEQLR